MTSPGGSEPMLQSFGCYLPHPTQAGTVVAPAYDSLTADNEITSVTRTRSAS